MLKNDCTAAAVRLPPTLGFAVRAAAAPKRPVKTPIPPSKKRPQGHENLGDGPLEQAGEGIWTKPPAISKTATPPTR